MKKLTAMLATTLLVQGCTYAISPELADKADQTVSFEQLLADPDLYKGKILILGGVINQITLKPQGSLISVSQRPLDYWGKPLRTSRSGGRFLLFHARAFDTYPYAPGKELTAAAEVAGTKLEALGNQEFADPVLIVKEIRLWDTKGPVAGLPRWGDPLYNPYSREPGMPQ